MVPCWLMPSLDGTGPASTSSDPPVLFEALSSVYHARHGWTSSGVLVWEGMASYCSIWKEVYYQAELRVGRNS